MTLILSLGTNLGDRIANLEAAKDLLCNKWKLIEQSRIYQSKAVDYEKQPDFLNQVLSFQTPNDSPQFCLDIALGIENELGRIRNIPKGPRVIDIDFLFWNHEAITTKALEIPHPRLFERSFIVKPLRELECFKTLSESFEFPDSFCNEAFAFKKV